MEPNEVDSNTSEINQFDFKVQTGLFVNCEKSRLLIHIVQSMLNNRFNTAAMAGPRQPDSTCEIILQSLNPTGADFVGSKELLQHYMRIVKESRPNAAVEKRPEVIDLDSDDEITCIVSDNTVKESITVIDLESSTISESDHLAGLNNECMRQTNCSAANVSDSGKSQIVCNEEITVINSVKRKTRTLNSKSHTGCILKESNRQGLKRKRKIKNKQRLEVVEILDDDDIVVLDDSFSTLSTNTQDQDQINVGCNITTHLESATSNHIIQPEFKQETFKKRNNDRTVNGCNSMPELSSSIRKKSLTVSNKKVSKMSYMRPAHLIESLTKNSSNEVKKVDSLSNIYNPNAELAVKRTGLRPIVIDGNNVAVSHGKGQFSLMGIQICINYFEKRGHRQIKAFVPQYRKNRDNHDELHKMERQGTVVITPSRKVNGKVLASYDDRYIVQYANEFDGVIVSTDNYRDLLQENASWKETIENRLLMFTWVDNLLMFPQDPLGRSGPTLDDFLKFPDTL